MTDNKCVYLNRGSTAIFYINGATYEVPSHLPIDTSLNAFLQHQVGLRDTKTMCLEGGCGACVVSARYKHPVSGDLVYRAVNSCLVSVYSCHGWDITTASGLGDKKSGYHSLQTTLAKYNGTQCGYCSPGMVMNMHSLLEDNKNITMKEIEDSFGGNICRCTGYRPIMDAFKSLASDADFVLVDDLQDIEDLDLGRLMKCPRTGTECPSSCIPNCFSAKINDTTWYKVTTIKEIFDLLRKHQSLPYMLVSGNTGQGVFRTKVAPKIYIDITGVAELRNYRLDNDLVLGANITLTDMMKCLSEVAGMDGYDYLQEIKNHLNLVANIPVRNVSTIAGNLTLKHQNPEFSSDIFLVLEAAGAFLKIVNMEGVELMLTPADFLKIDIANKIIVSVTLPPIKGNYAFKTYKIMKRAQNTHAYVNAGFYVRFDNTTGNIYEATIVYGGINPSFIHASKTENALHGVNIFNNTILTGILDCLNSELQPVWKLPDASPEYRKNLALCLFYKFVLNMCPEKLISPINKSGAKLLTRGLSSGEQKYETHKEWWPLQEPVTKLEALYQCAGEAEYVAYIPLKPGELYGAFVLARKPLTTIANIDAKDALEMNGVKEFYSAKDIPGQNTFMTNKMLLSVEDEEIFCSGFVKYYGQPVGVIVAETQQLADRAAQMVHIDYKSGEKKPYVNVRDVLAHDNVPSRVKLEKSYEATSKGDDIAHVFMGSQDMNSQYHFTMETQTVVCVPVEDGLDVYPSSQSVDNIQIAISTALNMPEHKINVNVRRLGGTFGCKISRNNQIAAACSVAAYHLNTPVRMVMSIEDNMDAIGKRNCSAIDYVVASNKEGKIQYLKCDIYEDVGCSFNESPVIFAVEMLENCYDKSRFTVNGYAILTDTPSSTWFRGPGATEGFAMVENIMEHIAHVTGVEPLDVRLANMRTKDNLVYDIIDDFRKKTEYDNRKKEINEFNIKNRWRKRGISIVPMSFPIIYYGKLSSMVCIYHGDGTVAVSHAGVECGQGINTKVAQVCAYTLGVPLDLVSIKSTNNFATPNSVVTAGSVTSESCCYATMEACKVIMERLNPIKEKLGGNPKWKDLVDEAHKDKVDLQAIYAHNPDTVNNAYHVAGLACCEVEVDLLTGNIILQRVDIREETGESISPEIDVGQVEGAFVNSLGYWLTEKMVYDKTTGELKTNRTWNYTPPGAKDIPVDFRIEFTRNAKNPVGILRSKATGEPAMLLGFSAVCAIRHALQSARKDANDGKPDKWFSLGAPTTPEDIFLHANNDYRVFTV